ETQQVREVVRGKIRPDFVMLFSKDFFQRGRPVVVQEAIALANTSQGRRIESALAALVREADVVNLVRGVGQRRNVAMYASLRLEQTPAALHLIAFRPARRLRLQRRGHGESMEERHEVLDGPRSDRWSAHGIDE